MIRSWAGGVYEDDTFFELCVCLTSLSACFKQLRLTVDFSCCSGRARNPHLAGTGSNLSFAESFY